MRRLTLISSDAAPESSRQSSYDTILRTQRAVFGPRKGPKIYLENWLQDGILTSLMGHFASIKTIVPTPHNWDLVWQLFSLKRVESEGNIRLFLEEGSNYHDVLQAIWESRNDHPLDLYVGAITKWLSGEHQDSEEWSITRSLGLGEAPTAFDRTNILFFITSIASQNNLLKPYTLGIDGLDTVIDDESFTSDLFDLCLTAERWSRIGNPITIELDLPAHFIPGDTRLGDLIRANLV